MELSNIVLYPSPGRGHLASMVEFGNHLLTHHPDSFSVTVIITAAAPSLAASNKSLKFHLLPDIAVDPTSPPFTSATLHNPDLRIALLSIPNVTAFVADFFCGAAAEVTADLNIDTYFYFTSGANGLALFLYFPSFIRDFAGSVFDLGDEIVRHPGLPPIPASDFPISKTGRDERLLDFFLGVADRLIASAGIIVNTFDVFEEIALGAVVAGECVPDGPTPPIYCIGPLVSAAADGGPGERHECLNWLDSQPSQSVLFLSFGSMGRFSKEQLNEIAVALERSSVRFLWVVRSPPPDGPTRPTTAAPEPDLDLDSILPQGFRKRTRERGYVAKSWAPQVEVLSHDSVGGFVTHCGWNSVLEAVIAGVPMIAWPLYAEQMVNRAFLVKEAKAALTVAESDGGFVSATELEERVTELMDSEKGRAVRERVKALRESAKAALSETGSSRKTLAELAESLK